MIGTLLKQLIRALHQYIAFHIKRVFGRGKPQETLAGTSPAETPAPSPSETQQSQPNYSPLPRTPVAGVSPIYEPMASFDWQILSRPHGLVYLGGPSPSVLELLVEEPKFILDVGCSNGDFAANVKQRFPQAQVWGVEPNEPAARIAGPRIDRVLCQMFEDIDWNREGVRRGDIDTVLLFDVLEHIYDPWNTLLTLRNLVSEKGQLVVSIPNVRNVLLIQDLISGYWRYRRSGLLDITHIRFFTQSDMYRMFYQTGFRVVATAATHCARSAEILAKHRDGKFPQTIELESASITVHSSEDLAGLCTVQHMFTLQPADYDQLSPGERQFIDAPHPPTMAFAPD
ncbi:MAG TPA: class I SAM-dependent methyltransferase [Steroidobacteraceae bacterium]|nr:class I SAM-dependent methyltransferase [Steroidobacteraceae bacterium]